MEFRQPYQSTAAHNPLAIESSPAKDWERLSLPHLLLGAVTKPLVCPSMAFTFSVVGTSRLSALGHPGARCTTSYTVRTMEQGSVCAKLQSLSSSRRSALMCDLALTQLEKLVAAPVHVQYFGWIDDLADILNLSLTIAQPSLPCTLAPSSSEISVDQQNLRSCCEVSAIGSPCWFSYPALERRSSFLIE